MEILEVRLYGNGCIKQNRENGLSSTGIVNNLSRKEEILIVLRKIILFLDVFGPLEEENKAIDVGLDPVDKLIIIEGIYLLDLHCGSSHALYQLGEYTWIWFNCAPLIKHFIFKSLYSLKKAETHIFFENYSSLG